ncbi:MAG: hypothetical protein M1834_000003 [Cirrosporium novae-zelandiae]|nr:MAG: hypothetical protein M1834_000003 [Cirrosporium novae-zelandiae]
MNTSPIAPSQPPKETAYTTPSNPTTTQPAEDKAASASTTFSSNSSSKNPPPPTDHRTPHSIPSTTSDSQPQPTSLGYGTHSPLPPISNSQSQPSPDGSQMHPPGEGKVYKQQLEKHNRGFGEQEDLAGELERKKNEQRGEREEVKEARGMERRGEGGVDVGEVLERRG